MPLNFKIARRLSTLTTPLQLKIDQKTKPTGALGQLEELALTIGLIQNTLTPRLDNPCIIVFAGDHGLVEAGVSAYPQTVTAQMVANFLAGGAAINVFAKQHNIELLIVDAGVNADLSAYTGLIHAKIANGTQNCLTHSAMTEQQALSAIKKGAELVKTRQTKGCNCIGFGEMGIGNTSSAALIMHCLTGLPLAQCTGRGAGLNDAQLTHKLAALQQSLDRHPGISTALAALQTFGGFEIAMMTGAYLQAAGSGMVIMVDGFIACAALLIAATLHPAVLDYCLFSHVSHEQGHQALLKHFNAKALLNLDMRLGEGSGIAIAYPLLQSAVLFLNKMASFEEAGVDH
ncbi:MAG: nicotinate-nucleotide--dimethylbenzimidazole phosphoribosyltransferase [Methylococcaceae bacterium]